MPITLREAKRIAEGLGWEIRGPSYTSLPRLRQALWHDYRTDIETLEEFLKDTYVIIDGFEVSENERENEDAREKGLSIIRQQHQDFADWAHKKSKLRWNVLLHSAYGRGNILERMASRNPDAAKSLESHFDPRTFNPIAYHAMNLNRKIAFSQNVDAETYAFWQVLAGIREV